MSNRTDSAPRVPQVHPDCLYTFEQLSGGPLDGVARQHPEAEYIAPPPDPSAPRRPGRPLVYPWATVPLYRWFRPMPGTTYPALCITVSRENAKAQCALPAVPDGPQDLQPVGRLFKIEWEPGVGSVIWRIR